MLQFQDKYFGKYGQNFIWTRHIQSTYLGKNGQPIIQFLI